MLLKHFKWGPFWRQTNVKVSGVLATALFSSKRDYYDKRVKPVGSTAGYVGQDWCGCQMRKAGPVNSP